MFSLYCELRRLDVTYLTELDVALQVVRVLNPSCCIGFLLVVHRRTHLNQQQTHNQ